MGLALLALPPVVAFMVKEVIRMWLLWLFGLDMSSGFLTCAVVPPCLLFEVSIRLTSHQKNPTLYNTSFSFMLRWSWCLRPLTFDELTKVFLKSS